MLWCQDLSEPHRSSGGPDDLHGCIRVPEAPSFVRTRPTGQRPSHEPRLGRRSQVSRPPRPCFAITGTASFGSCPAVSLSQPCCLHTLHVFNAPATCPGALSWYLSLRVRTSADKHCPSEPTCQQEPAILARLLAHALPNIGTPQKCFCGVNIRQSRFARKITG